MIHVYHITGRISLMMMTLVLIGFLLTMLLRGFIQMSSMIMHKTPPHLSMIKYRRNPTMTAGEMIQIMTMHCLIHPHPISQPENLAMLATLYPVQGKTDKRDHRDTMNMRKSVH